jgi:hypothetical protein
MSIDERDYYYDPKQSRESGVESENAAHVNDEKYWRRISSQQQEQKRNLVILGIGVIALVWLFGGEMSRYLQSLSWPHIQSGKVFSRTPPVIPPHPNSSELQFPESGSIIQYQTPGGISAKFSVVSAQGRTKNCVVKLERWNDGLPVVELFVRVGEQAETQAVPLGEYRAKIACGTHWYGRNFLFGSDTLVSVGETPLRFWQSGSTINGNILTLTKELGGNFKTNDSYYNKF